MTVSSFWNSRLTSLKGERIRRTFSTAGSPSNSSGSSFRSSPIAPMMVRSTPRDMWALKPLCAQRLLDLPDVALGGVGAQHDDHPSSPCYIALG